MFTSTFGRRHEDKATRVLGLCGIISKPAIALECTVLCLLREERYNSVVYGNHQRAMRLSFMCGFKSQPRAGGASGPVECMDLFRFKESVRAVHDHIFLLELQRPGKIMAFS